MRAKLAQLQLKDYRYHEVHLVANEAFIDAENIPETVEYIPDIEIKVNNQENGEFAVFLNTRIDDDCIGNFSQSPYKIVIGVSGLFKLPEFGEPMEEEQLYDLKYLNAPAILYGLTREKVNQLTANGIFGPVTLPSINLVETMLSSKKHGTEQQTE